MKRILALVMAFCLLLVGCGVSQPEAGDNTAAEIGTTEQTKTGKTIYPLPDTTMENLTDAILAISLEKGDAYVDDTGKLQMDVKIYTYDKYDLVDISTLAVGDTIVRYSGEVEVTSMEKNEAGTIIINGGEEAGGFDLATDDTGVFFELGFNDAKNWYEVGEATLRVSADMQGIDNADPDQGEVIFYPGDLLNDAIENFRFTPHNTTVRLEDGQVIEMTRRYVP